MGYKIRECTINKISTPVICRFGDESKTFSNGSALMETAFDKPYKVDEIKIENGELVLLLSEDKSYMENGPINWIGEEAVM